MAETRTHLPLRAEQQHRKHLKPHNSQPATPPTPELRLAYAGPTSATEITYLYLTFSTPLPQANTSIRALSNYYGRPLAPAPPTPPPPPPPDLTRFANPQHWPNWLKNVHLALACTATFLAAYASGAYSPPQELVQESLRPQPGVEAVVAGMTTFCVGFALAPMVLAPLSEMNGRYPVFVVAGVVWVVSQAACALTPRVEVLLAARFFAGAGSSVFSSMVGGVIADMWHARARNTPMALFSASALAGLGAGPLVGAVMAQRLAEDGGGGDDDGDGWKWIFWHQVVAGGLLMVALALIFRESRGSVVLSRKAGRLNRWYEKLEGAGCYGVWCNDEAANGERTFTCACLTEGDEEKGALQHLPRQTATAGTLKRIRWLVKEDEERSSLGKMMAISVTRPFHLLFTEPVVFFFSLWAAFAWGILYLALGAIPFVFEKVYAWSLEQSGYSFAPIIIGTVIQTALSIWQEQMLQHPKWATRPPDSITPSSGDISDGSASKSSQAYPVPVSHSDSIWRFLRRRFPAEAPESRLYFACLTSTLLPIGLFVFGFTALPDIHWTAPQMGLVLATMGIMSIYLAVFNYFADTYHKYASSALAAQSFCRNVLGGAFPLATVALYKNLGEAKAGALLGGIATALTIVPWVLVFFGRRIRARSRFASLETT
ncbi:putative drug/proton antiporter YHK8 [Madurella mycetomatis]|uniref:Drug/proton antiporter YHK8 n=1 Tax=Madurella mycetomatis TaxID=100816 RepID=A0A175VSX6_9PEZI|nr:putative drug/proton antiporter YHK8 [Madurella mycetomatis]